MRLVVIAMSDRFVAAITKDRSRVVMTRGTWRHTIPAEQAKDWLVMYRKLWGRKATKPGEPGPYARFYESTVARMEKVVAEIEGGRHAP